MTDYSQIHLLWPFIAVLLIGLAAGWFLQRFVLVKQMEELETQHLDVLRSAEDEMHAARDEARLQGQKLDEAQMAITLGYERLTLLDRRLKESEERLLPAPAGSSAQQTEEIDQLKRELAEQQVFAERLSQLESDLAAAKAVATPDEESHAQALRERDLKIESLQNEVAEIESLRLRLSEMVSESSELPKPAMFAQAVASREAETQALRERDLQIESLQNEVAEIEPLRLRLSEMVSELGLAQSQITRAQSAASAESSNELVRKLTDAIARRQELEIALSEANERIALVEAERDAVRIVGVTQQAEAPKAMAAGAGAGRGMGMGFSASDWQAEHPEPPSTQAKPMIPRREEDIPEPVIPLLSPAQLAGGLSQLLFENRVQFGTDRSDILTDSKMLLEDIADLILCTEPVRLVVEGHTERGDARACFYLSERRAVAVMERLVKLGVPENRMMTVGYGDTRPIDENSSYEGRMRNRRIEIRILGRV